MPELRSDQIDGKYVLVRNNETREAIAVFKFDWVLHRKMISKYKRKWDIDAYDYEQVTEPQVDMFIKMKLIPLWEQKAVYQSRTEGF